MKIAIAALMMLAGCSAPAFDYETPVKQSLRDPASAHFSDVTVNVESACGFVNSKNGFGGYAGKVPFIAISNGVNGADVIFVEGQDERDAIEARCLEPAKSKIDAWITEKVVSDLNG
jgi:hypothetical protein